MDNFNNTARPVLIAIIVAILCGFGGWYVYLQSKIRQNNTVSAGRGLGATVPTGTVNTNSNTAGAFGSPDTGGTGSAAVSAGVATTASSSQPDRLWHVITTAVGGAGFLSSTSSVQVRFVERATGHVSDASLSGHAVTRVTNTLVPLVYDAEISPKGSLVLQTASDAFLATVSTSSSAAATLQTKSLAHNLRALSISPTGKEMFALIKTSSGVVGQRFLSDGTNQKQVFSSGIVGWKTQWLGDGRIILAQAASDGAMGYAYELKSDGSLGLIASAPGLTILPRASSTAVLIGASNKDLSLSVRVGTSTIALPLKTLAEKCVWSPLSQLVMFCAVPQTVMHGFLDLWYRGEMHGSDQWWRIEALTGKAEVLFAPDHALDVQDPIIDASGQYIVFKDAKDQSLWSLRINP